MQELILLAVALFAGWTCHALRMPVFVGYLVAGFILSAWGFSAPPLMEKLGHLGVWLLLFVVGLHIRIEDILRREVLLVGLTHLVLGCAMFIGIASLLGTPLEIAVFLGVVLSFSSTVLAAKELERRNELTAFHGRIAIGILILQDIAAIAVMVFAGNEPLNPLVLGVILVFFLARPVIHRLLRSIEDNELGILFGIALVAGSATVFETLGASGELGAIFAGILCAGNRQADIFAEQIWSLKTLLLAMFFLQIGMIGWPDTQVWYWVAPILLILPAKAAFYFLLLIAARLRARSAFLTSASLTSYSEFTLIAGAVGVSTGVIPEPALQLLALLTVFSFAIYLPVNSLINNFYDALEPQLLRFERSGHHLDHPPTSLGETQVLVVGVGRTGHAAFEWLHEQHIAVAGIEIDPQRLKAKLDHHQRVVFGDALDRNFWTSLNLMQLKAILICIPGHGSKIRVIKLLKENGFNGTIAVFGVSAQELDQLSAAGATLVNSLLNDAGERMAEQVLAGIQQQHDSPQPHSDHLTR